MSARELSFRRIGVWQTAFLGDAVLTLPLLQALKTRFPDAELHFFVRAGVEGLFAAQRELTSVRPFAKRGAQSGFFAARGFGRQLALEAFDLWISPHTSLRSAYIARAVGAPVRIGYDRPWHQWLAYTHLVDRRFSELHEVDRLMQLVLPLDMPTKPPKPRLDLPPEGLDRAEQIFSGLPPGRVLGIHPGSTWATKCWPAEYFAETARRALLAGCVVLLFAGPGEEDLAARIAEGINDATHRFFNLAGMLSIPALAACMGRADACLTNDSGPMHLAWVQDTPLVAVFGPTVERLGFFPLGANSRVVQTDLDCRPCGLHGHKTCPLGTHACMRKISPDRVWAALAPLLEI